MERRMAVVTKVGRIVMLAVLMAAAEPVAAPVVAYAKSPKCVPMPVPGQPGTYVLQCSTSRP